MRVSSFEYIAIDVETTGTSFKKDTLHGLGVSLNDDHFEYYRPNDIPLHVRRALQNPNTIKVAVNRKFDLRFCAENGIQVAGDTWCLRLMGHALDENASNSLASLGARYLKERFIDNKNEMASALAPWGFKHVGEMCAADLGLFNSEKLSYIPGSFFSEIHHYNIGDLRNTRALFPIMGKALRELNEKVKITFQVPKGPLDHLRESAMPADDAILAMELRGLDVNTAILEEQKAKYETDRSRLLLQIREAARPHIGRIEDRLYEEARSLRSSEKGKANVERGSEKYKTLFNFGSSDHFGELLYKHLGFTERLTSKGNYRTDEATLNELATEARASSPPNQTALDVLGGLSQARTLGKMLGTYVEGPLSLIHEGRIYPEYAQFLNTWRLNCQAPNMQNIPRGSREKRAYVAPPGQCFVYLDYSQVELRIAAHLSQCPVMLSWFNDGLDPHQMIGDSMGVERQVGKTMNFLTIFDGKAHRLLQAFQDAGITKYALEDCTAFLQAYWERVPHYRAYLDNELAKLKRYRVLVAPTGAIRRLPEIAYEDFLDHRFKRFNGPAAMQDELSATLSIRGGPDYVYNVPAAQRPYVLAKVWANHAKKQAYNFPIQHLGAVITKAAMVALRAAGFCAAWNGHDALAVPVPVRGAKGGGEALAEITKIAESAYKLSVPLKVDARLTNSLDEKDRFLDSQ